MTHDIRDQIPGNVEFFLAVEEEPEATLLHVLEKTYLPGKMLVDNCEPGQPCLHVGSVLYQQPDSTHPQKNIPFARAYVIKVSGTAPPDTSLQVTSVMTGYDPHAVLCKIKDALGQ